jgi:hypothetical protein
VNYIGVYWIDDNGSDIEIGQAGIELSPAITAVGASEDTPAVSTYVDDIWVVGIYCYRVGQEPEATRSDGEKIPGQPAIGRP